MRSALKHSCRTDRLPFGHKNKPSTRSELETSAAKMARVLLTAIGLLIVAVAIAVAYFAITDLPPPSGKIEHVIPESRMPK
jgi:hypothetical protein